MHGKEILFVSYQDETFEEGMSYAIYLAGMLSLELRILLLGKNGLLSRPDDMMNAVSSIESENHVTSLELIPDTSESPRMHLHIMEKCKEAGLKASVHSRLSNSITVIKDILNNTTIDMVLLSPSVSKSDKLLKTLVKNSGYPVISINQWKSLGVNIINQKEKE